MKKLKNNRNEILSDTNSILKETENFYTKLYENKDYYLEEVNLVELIKDRVPKLSDDEAILAEGSISKFEAVSVLKNMKNNKSPGSDGYTVEFFKFFWKDIGSFLVRSINYGFQNKTLSSTQKEGVIICLPKGDKPKEFLKNWRPISLLNTSYKIASACISNRIKRLLPKIIHTDQTGFVPGRYIGDNTRLLYDILDYLKQRKIAACFC